MIGPTAHVETLVGSVVVRPGLARLGLGLTVKNKSIVPQFEVGLGLVQVKAVNQCSPTPAKVKCFSEISIAQNLP